jgi:hypothetical protein
MRSIIGVHTEWTVGHGQIHATRYLCFDGDIRIDTGWGRGFSGDETFPCFVAFFDDFEGVLLVLAFTTESEGILLLAIGNLSLAHPTNTKDDEGTERYLVNSPEFIRSTEKSREMSFNVFNVVEFGSERVIHVDGDDFPIGFTLVEESHGPQDFDLFDLSWISDFFANLADINWIIVALCLSFGV